MFALQEARVATLLRTTAVVMVVDQLSKGAVLTFAPQHVTYNTGAAFSLPTPAWLVVIVLGLLVALVVQSWRSPLLNEERRAVALGLMLGGALSNVVDRISRGAVLDFIDLKLWPIFNLADVAIVLGAALFIWYAWRTSHERPARQARLDAGKPPAPTI